MAGAVLQLPLVDEVALRLLMTLRPALCCSPLTKMVEVPAAKVGRKKYLPLHRSQSYQYQGCPFLCCSMPLNEGSAGSREFRLLAPPLQQCQKRSEQNTMFLELLIRAG